MTSGAELEVSPGHLNHFIMQYSSLALFWQTASTSASPYTLGPPDSTF